MRASPTLGSGRPLRILMVAACGYPSTQGTQVYLRGQNRALLAAGHEVHMVTYDYSEVGVESCGATLHRARGLRGYRKLRAGPSWSKPWLDLMLLIKLVSVARDLRPDLIHAHNYEAPIAAYIARAGLKIPVVYGSHNLMVDELESYFDRPWSRWLARGLAVALDKSVPRGADACITLSSAAVDELQRLGVPPELVHHIPPGVDPEDFPAGDCVPKPGPDDPRSTAHVVYAGNPDGYQDLELLFDAVRIARLEHPGLRLRMISSAELGPTLRIAESRGLPVDAVESMTSSDWPDVRRAMSECQVAALPRRVCRGYPIKLLNYLAMGLPVVACEGSAMGLDDNRFGRVVGPCVEEFAAALTDLVRSPGRSYSMGVAGRRWVLEGQTWSARVPYFERVYRDVLRHDGDSSLAGSILAGGAGLR